MVEVLRNAGTILIVVTAALSWITVVLHHLLARWWETEFGRHTFAFELVVAVVSGLWALRLLIPEGDWFQAVRLAAFAAVPLVVAWRIRILIIAWRTVRLEAEHGRDV